MEIMYAIAKIAGKQFRIEVNRDVKVPLLDLKEGSSYEINEILFTTDGKNVKVGEPILTDVKAKAKVVEHGRHPKIIVFRKKRRKGFEVTRGHRQDYTLLHVEKIDGLTAQPKKAAKPKAEVKPKKDAKPKKTAAKPKAKPKTAAKPKVAAKPKTAAKPKAESKTKTAAKTKKAPAKKKTETKKSSGE